MYHLSRTLSRTLIIIWIANCALACMIAIKQVWIPYMDAGSDSYSKIVSLPFDGTVMPITYIPDWTKASSQDKTKRFEDIDIKEYLPIPLYDPISLLDSKNQNKATTILRYTYITTYMGNYKLDYSEYAGGHLGVDIRAPIGTPVLSIANGVVIRIVEADLSGNKFIVVRHDRVPMNGGYTSLYSGYLHLSEILVKEGDLVRKGDMIGRVGNTGITTTPHLHIQIDREDAPFHPYWHFTSSESKALGWNFYDAVNNGLNKDKALRYTLHPMTFILSYLGGLDTDTLGTRPIEINTLSAAPVIVTPPSKISNLTITKNISASAPPKKESTIAAQIIAGEFDCIGKRFRDISAESNFGKILYPLVDKKCLFDEKDSIFGPKDMITFREALINSMRYFKIEPTNGTSHFLDIPIGDVLQGYALVAYRKGVLDGSYAYPDRIISREELIKMLGALGVLEDNPSEFSIYRDIDTMNLNFGAIQDYALSVGARGGKFYPKNLVTRAIFVQMISNIKEKN